MFTTGSLERPEECSATGCPGRADNQSAKNKRSRAVAKSRIGFRLL